MLHSKVANYVIFQAGWLACVIGAANNLSSVGVAWALVGFAIYLLQSKNRIADVLAISTITIVGFGWDSLLLQMGVLAYSDNQFISLAPLWIAAIWIMFATTLNSSMAWMQGRYVLATVLGALFGPLAYYSASRLGAVELIAMPDALIMLSVAWAMLMPAMLLCIKHAHRSIPQLSKEACQ